MTDTEMPPTNGETNGPPMTLGGRLTNVFVAPTEVFDDVKNTPPQPANWLVPLVTMIIVGIVYSFVVFSQPRVLQQMKEPMEQKFDQMVKSGKITRQVADQQLQMMEKFMSPEFMKAMGIVGTVIGQPVFLFLMALLLWIIGRFAFKSEFEYMKAVEAVGLANIIMVPCSIVTICLTTIYGNLAMTPGPVLLVSHFDQQNPWHALLSSLNLGFIWYIAVLAVALARLGNTTFIKAALWGFGLWACILVLKVGSIIITRNLNG